MQNTTMTPGSLALFQVWCLDVDIVPKTLAERACEWRSKLVLKATQLHLEDASMSRNTIQIFWNSDFLVVTIFVVVSSLVIFETLPFHNLRILPLRNTLRPLKPLFSNAPR